MELHLTSSLPSLLITTILRCMPDARNHSLVCSAGSQGYHALKEMLLSGVPGNTLLIESGDLREVVDSTAAPEDGEAAPPCFNVYVSHPSFLEERHDSSIDDRTTHITLYTNMTTLPHSTLADCFNLTHIDVSIST